MRAMRLARSASPPRSRHRRRRSPDDARAVLRGALGLEDADWREADAGGVAVRVLDTPHRREVAAVALMRVRADRDAFLGGRGRPRRGPGHEPRRDRRGRPGTARARRRPRGRRRRRARRRRPRGVPRRDLRDQARRRDARPPRTRGGLAVPVRARARRGHPARAAGGPRLDLRAARPCAALPDRPRPRGAGRQRGPGARAAPALAPAGRPLAGLAAAPDAGATLGNSLAGPSDGPPAAARSSGGHANAAALSRRLHAERRGSNHGSRQTPADRVRDRDVPARDRRRRHVRRAVRGSAPGARTPRAARPAPPDAERRRRRTRTG